MFVNKGNRKEVYKKIHNIDEVKTKSKGLNIFEYIGTLSLFSTLTNLIVKYEGFQFLKRFGICEDNQGEDS